MRFSKLFTKTLKDVPKDEKSINAQLLIRAGFVFKNSAGVYSYLPLGWRVIEKINKVIREEMDAIGGQEVFMPALISKEILEKTKRWSVDIGFKVLDNDKPEAVLGWTHEEVITHIATKYISSYKDLPLYVYQIQTKFRNEPRPRSGLIRGREFLMKDLYSFHTDYDDLDNYYQKVKKAYENIALRLGLDAVWAEAGGGEFTENITHELQVLTPSGEDTIYYCNECGWARNKEIIEDSVEDCVCPEDGGKIVESRGIEIGNVFKLGTRFSEAFNLKYKDKNGDEKLVVMGSYGIGPSRLMGTIVEVHHDDKGIVWPRSSAPFDFHLIVLDNEKEKAEIVYDRLQKLGDVLYDDRYDVSAGEKFNDADLIGCPLRVLVSKKTLEKNSVEIKRRDKDEIEIINFDNLDKLKDYI